MDTPLKYKQYIIFLYFSAGLIGNDQKYKQLLYIETYFIISIKKVYIFRHSQNAIYTSKSRVPNQE